jgi:glycerophosphoryl diester phosphodiesterase
MRNRILFLSALIAIILINPFDASARKYKGTAIVAHRGFWNCEAAGYAKNSIASLKCAQEAGVWGSEFDVNMTSDGVLLVFHDSKIDGKRIEKHPYEDFKYYRLKNGEPIPTLEQYLEQAKKHPKTKLVYELKSHSCAEVEDRFVDITIQKLKENDLLDPSKVIFIAFSYHICQRLAEKLPEFTVQYLNGDKSPQELKAAGINGLDYHFSHLKRHDKWSSQARELDMSVNAWTVDQEADMKAMFEQKVDMLTTDNPLKARALMKELKVKEIK